MNEYIVRARFTEGDLIVEVAGVEGHQPIIYRADQMLPFSKLAAQPHLLDFFEFMLVMYTADRLVCRSPRRWSRKFVVVFPVSRLSLWESACADIEQLLWQSTGDHVTLRPFDRTPADGVRADAHLQWFALEHVEPTAVVLLSDGLDSLCGAFDACKDREGRVAFVSLLSNSRKYEPIGAVIKRLRDLHGNRVVYHPIPMHLEDAPEKQERTQRSRTMLAIAAGLTVAAAYESSEVIVSENGMGILNLPVSSVQLRHESSQVLHPSNLALWATISRRLIGGASVRYSNRFKTKARMLADLPETARDLIRKTSSCDRPQRRDKYADCAVCGSCLYRKIALRDAGLSHYDTTYTRRPPKKLHFDPIDVLMYQASQLAAALNDIDPWPALVRLQPTLRNAVAGVSLSERAHVIAATIALLRQHVAELHNVRDLAHAV